MDLSPELALLKDLMKRGVALSDVKLVCGFASDDELRTTIRQLAEALRAT
jgi:hypothetical protein